MDAAESPYKQTIVNGQNYLQKRCPMVLGISIGNPHYYNQETLEGLFSMAKTSSDKVMIFMADTENTYRALGHKNPEKKAREQASQLRKKCEKAMLKIGCSEKQFSFVRWLEDVRSCPAYLEALNSVENIYQQNPEFRCELQESTKRVLTNIKKRDDSQTDRGPKSGFDIEEGVKYILKELAFFQALPKIYMNFDKFIFVYHRNWPVFFDKFFIGHYDGIIKSYLGFVIFE